MDVYTHVKLVYTQAITLHKDHVSYINEPAVYTHKGCVYTQKRVSAILCIHSPWYYYTDTGAQSTLVQVRQRGRLLPVW